MHAPCLPSAIVDPVRALPELIKHVGRGARLARDLSREEASRVMRLLIAGEADPVQVGGFLMAMRMKGEAPEELAGFVDAMGERQRPIAAPAGAPLVDVDLHADGREGRPVVTLAAACLATAAGARVLVRGSFGGRFARHDLDEVFTRLGVPPAAGPEAAERALARGGVGVVHLGDLAPGAAALLELREKLGVRTCVNSAIKLLDPARGGRLLVGIFHSPYHASMASAARLLGARRAAIVQAPGGVPEPAPDRPTRITFVDAESPPSEPVAFDGAGAPLARPGAAPPPPVEDAARLAALLDDALRHPAAAPPGVARMIVLEAALITWVAGLAPSPTEAALLGRLAEAYHGGRAAPILDVTRMCYERCL